jgi:hypothetical protein
MRMDQAPQAIREQHIDLSYFDDCVSSPSPNCG